MGKSRPSTVPTPRTVERPAGVYLAEQDYIISTSLAIGYVVIGFLANLTVAKPLPLGPAISIPIGSLLYAISFTWIDIVNDYLGKRRARILVVAALTANLIAIAWFELYVALPGTPSWNENPANGSAISFVFGAYWRVYAASLAVSFIVQNMDITVYSEVRSRWPAAPRWARSALSNTVSGPLDAVLFSVLAFAGSLPLRSLLEIIAGGALYKLAVGYLSAPLIYLVRARHEVQRSL